jgi:putative transposase
VRKSGELLGTPQVLKTRIGEQKTVTCSPSSVYRALKKAGLLRGQTPNVTKEGTGFVQPLKAHQEWHADVSYLNIACTFYYLCSLLDCYSRFIVHWEIRETMKEAEVTTIIQRASKKNS